VPFEKGLSAKSEVSLAIYNKFKAAGIRIPFPQRDLHIKSLPEGGRKDPLAGSEE
jgi:small-conductance mechanosensitive channel